MNEDRNIHVVHRAGDGDLFLQFDRLDEIDLVHIRWIGKDAQQDTLTVTQDEMAELCAAFLAHCPHCDPDEIYTLTPEAKALCPAQPTLQPSPVL